MSNNRDEIILSIKDAIDFAKKDTNKTLNNYSSSLQKFIHLLIDEKCDITYKTYSDFETSIEQMKQTVFGKTSAGYKKTNSLLKDADINKLYEEYKEIYSKFDQTILVALSASKVEKFYDEIQKYEYYKIINTFINNRAINASLKQWIKYLEINSLEISPSDIKIKLEIDSLEKEIASTKINLENSEDVVLASHIMERQRTNKALSEEVKLNANGNCFFNCSNDIFKTKNGPYLEVHHVIPLNYSKGKKINGYNLDCVDNLVAICPTCHRRLHLEDNESESFLKYHNILYEKVEKFASEVGIGTFDDYLKTLVIKSK